MGECRSCYSAKYKLITGHPLKLQSRNCHLQKMTESTTCYFLGVIISPLCHFRGGPVQDYFVFLYSGTLGNQGAARIVSHPVQNYICPSIADIQDSRNSPMTSCLNTEPLCFTLCFKQTRLLLLSWIVQQITITDCCDSSGAFLVFSLSLVLQLVSLQLERPNESFVRNRAHVGFLPTMCHLVALQSSCQRERLQTLITAEVLHRGRLRLT